MNSLRQRHALPAPLRASVIATLLALPAVSQAAEPAAPTQTLKKVEITDKQGDEARNRNAVAGKIIMGREEIERLGDSRAGELLARMPSVTVNDGRVSMRGLSGYTQILVDGRNPPAGFNLIELPANQIERIEVIRSGVAEFSAQGMAGTINVVLRQARPTQARKDGLRLELNGMDGRVKPAFGWSQDRPAEDGGPARTLSVNGASRENPRSSEELLSIEPLGGAGRRQIRSEEFNNFRFSTLNARGQWLWKPAADQTVSLSPNIGISEFRSPRKLSQQGSEPLSFDLLDNLSVNRSSSAGVRLKWARPLEGLGRLNLDTSVGIYSQRGSDEQRLALQGQVVPGRSSRNDGLGRSQDLSLGWAHEVAEVHNLSAGLETSRSRDGADDLLLLGAAPDPLLAGYDGRRNVLKNQYAAFFRDEWSVDNWSFNAGLRWEGQRQDLAQGSHQALKQFSLLAPSGHVLWRPEAKSRDQIRLSFSRSYKAPYDSQLLGRPSISPQQPCTIASCPTNSAAYPDVAPNPELRPEVASGLDLGFEHYQGKTGVFSLNLFVRHLEDHIRSEARLGPVDWSSAPRWVLRNRNIGQARSMGLEFDARGRLNEWLADAPAIEINAGLNLFRSSVEALPGPNNRLGEQPRANAKLGLQYQLPGLPWRLGSQLNWTAATPTRIGEQEWRELGRQFSASFNALWTVDKDSRLRISFSTPQTTHTGSERLTASERILLQREQRNAAGWGLKWETKI